MKYLMDDIVFGLICLIKNIINIHFDHLHSCYRQNTPHKTCRFSKSMVMKSTMKFVNNP